MNLSIIICTWNSAEDIEKCLYSLTRWTCPANCEIIIIDNNSTDNTKEIIRKFPLPGEPAVNLIENDCNKGLSCANNQGIKESNNEYLLFLNPDTVILDNALEKMVQFMEKDKSIGAMGPQHLNNNGRIIPSCREFPNFGNLIRQRKWKMRYFDHKSTREVDQPMGSCLLTRREIIDKIGGFNENYPLFMNDVDFCYRIKKAGYKIFFLEDAKIIHKVGGSTNKIRKKAILNEHWSMYRYLKDHFKNKVVIYLYGFLLLTGAFYRILFTYLSGILSGRRCEGQKVPPAP